MKRKARHHSCYKGRRVRITLPANVVVEGRFIEERSQCIVITVNGAQTKIPRKDLLTFGISRSNLQEGYYAPC